MPKIAIISDLHANLPALEAVLNALSDSLVKQIIHCGDAIGIGPFPAECLTRLGALPNFLSVRGNHDDYLLRGVTGMLPEVMSPGEAIHQRWTHAQISNADKKMVAAWPYTLNLSFLGLKMVFTHYGNPPKFSPFMKNPTAEQLETLFSAVKGDLIFYGHDHTAVDLTTSTRRFINPGSLGCQPTAVAPFCLVTYSKDSFLLEKRQVPYDDTPLREAFLSRNVPERETINNLFFGGRLF
jgi:putative phosphoesterase